MQNSNLTKLDSKCNSDSTRFKAKVLIYYIEYRVRQKPQKYIHEGHGDSKRISLSSKLLSEKSLDMAGST